LLTIPLILKTSTNQLYSITKPIPIILLIPIAKIIHIIFIEFMLSQIDTILDEISVQISEENEHLSEAVKKLLEIMEYDIPYKSKSHQDDNS